MLGPPTAPYGSRWGLETNELAALAHLLPALRRIAHVHPAHARGGPDTILHLRYLYIRIVCLYTIVFEYYLHAFFLASARPTSMPYFANIVCLVSQPLPQLRFDCIQDGDSVIVITGNYLVALRLTLRVRLPCVRQHQRLQRASSVVQAACALSLRVRPL